MILFVYLFISSGYMLFIAVAGKMRKAPLYSSSPIKKKIAILIPSYKEDRVILDTASRASQHDYPADSFSIFVIADKLQPETIEKLKAIPVHVVEVQFETSTKSKSMHAALESIPENDFDIVMVLDADNVMGAGCLEKVNHAFQNGFKAVQCHRTAKNKNNAVAMLDAISEEINNNLFRHGQRALGLSSALIGSGMAFEFKKFKAIFNVPRILHNPGEDGEIDLQLMKDNIIIEFIEDAWIFDEKVSSSEVFQKQRIRWLEAQVNNFKRFLDKDFRSVANTKMYWYKLFQTLLLPRSLYLLLFGVIICLGAFEYVIHYPFFFPVFPWWLELLGAFIISLVISIPKAYFTMDTMKAIVHLPALVLGMAGAMFKMKANRKEFLHTPKVHTDDSGL